MYKSTQICHQIYLGYLCKIICDLKLSKIAQPGHTGHGQVKRLES